MIQVPTPATRPATRGAKREGSRIELITPSHLTPPNPSAAMADPISPPNRACDDEDGSPSNQVVRFHRIPPTRPANTMVRMGTPISPSIGAPLLSWMERILLLTVRATSMERKAPTRFRLAERITAAFGFRAPVAMDVAI